MSLAAQGVQGVGPNLGYSGSQFLPTPGAVVGANPSGRLPRAEEDFAAPRLGAVVLGAAGVGAGDNYRPAPGLPPAKHLDYFNKLVQALVVVVLGYYLVRDPGKAFRALERRAGVR